MYLEIEEKENSYLTRLMTNKDNNKEVLLPHGSGINDTWVIEDKGDRYIAYNSYHYMNELGYYECWIDFSLVIPKRHPQDFKLQFHTNHIGWYRIYSSMLRDYLEDTFSQAFHELQEAE